jgi:hypothetical protein
MVDRERGFESKSVSLKIKGLRGGTVGEITRFLVDMDRAYSALFSFGEDVYAASLLRRGLRRGPYLDPDFWFFGHENLLRKEVSSPDQIRPDYRLELKSVSINSPGFWEFFGGLNPLQQIREYLKDRHERRKDKSYRESAEIERLRLDNRLLQRQILEKETGILREQLSILREFDIGTEEMRRLVWSRLGPSLSDLGRHQDNGLIEGPLENQ